MWRMIILYEYLALWLLFMIFSALYAILTGFRFVRSEGGLLLFGLTFGCGSLLTVAVGRLLFGDYPLREQITAFMVGLVIADIVWLITLLVRLQRRRRRSPDADHE